MLLALPLLVVAGALVGGRRARRWHDRGLPGPSAAAALVQWRPWALTFVTATCCVLTFPALVDIEGPTALLYALGAAALVALPSALVPGRAGRLVAALSIAALVLLTLADAVFWRFFGGLVPLLAASSGGQLWDIRESVWALFEARDLSLLPLLVFVVVLSRPTATIEVAPPRRVKRWVGTPREWGRAVRWGGVGLLALYALVAVGDVAYYLNHRYSWKVFESLNSVLHVGLGSAHLRDIARSTRERLSERSATEAEVEAHTRWYLDRYQPLAEVPGFGELAGANVLFVQLEAVQAWVVGAELGGVEVTPFLNGLREQGRYYTRIYDQTGSSPTSDCEYLVLNSQHPLDRGAVAFRRADNAFVTLPRLLKAQGYTTLSAHAYRRGMWNRALLHPRYGFDRSLFARELGDEPKVGWGLGDEVFFDKLVNELDTLQEPFFAFAITLTSHFPYKYIPKELQVLDTKGLKGALAGYMHSMRYVDDAVRSLFAGLERTGLADRTIVVLYGDHDAKLDFPRKRRRRAQKALGLDGTTLRSLRFKALYTDRVPLWLIPPRGKREPQRLSTVGGQIDIAPTVLHALGVPGSLAFAGRPLVGQSGRVVRHDGAAAERDHLWAVGPKESWCHAASGKRLPLPRCDALREGIDDELRHSWAVTLQNLAARLHARTPPPRTSQPDEPDGGR